MSGYHFFALMSRMKYINRWGLMNNTKNENICEHSLFVAIIAHALVIINNERFGGNLNAERAAVLGMFHDSTEIITGDLPTPVKYYNPKIRDAYKQVEEVAKDKLISMLPTDLQPIYEPLLGESESEKELLVYVKAADKITALIKCIEEKRMGNSEFIQAEKTLFKTINQMKIPAVNVFIEEMLPSYSLTLDEQE
ncbi:MAG: 5'-deoxynucleotidase [Bacillota bacterium]|nr:5'-deoxynucleotidase [Bacillota bacterium]